MGNNSSKTTTSTSETTDTIDTTDTTDTTDISDTSETTDITDFSKTLQEEKKEDKLKTASFGQIIDYIATKYILTMNFQSMTKLHEEEYCNELVILTSDIIKKYFNDLEIKYLEERVKKGVETNEMKTDNMIFFNKKNVEDKLNLLDEKKRERICNGIAKFYIKIAHIFAAIVTTINPVYTYKDADGNIIKRELSEKNKIPKGVERKLYKLGLCDNRLNSLKKGQDYSKLEDTDEKYSVHPNFCNINNGADGEIKDLMDEPGISELEELYEDDYDYKTGRFVGMTEETKKQYIEDVRKFYRVYTGNENIPDDIKKFSDIKLRDYNSGSICSDKLNKKYKGELKLYPDTDENKEKNESNRLFIMYAENIKNMMENINSSQEKLLGVINGLFTYILDPNTGKKRIIVNPLLTENGLQELVVKTRELIIDLYLQCEKDYVEGIKIYQAIVENKIKDTTIKQIAVLEKTSEKLLNDEINDERKKNDYEGETVIEDKLKKEIEQIVNDENK
jgi:hypothetical protein